MKESLQLVVSFYIRNYFFIGFMKVFFSYLGVRGGVSMIAALILYVLSLLLFAKPMNGVAFYVGAFFLHGICFSLAINESEPRNAFWNLLIDGLVVFIVSILLLLFSNISFEIWCKGGLLICLYLTFFRIFLLFLQRYLPVYGVQIILFVLMVFLTGGVLMVLPFLNYFETYEWQFKVFREFAHHNPLILIAEIFSIDPYHANSLYGLFESRFIVGKAEFMSSLQPLMALAVFFALWLKFFPHQQKKEKSSLVVNR